ncbi:MAG: Wzz/FepE/Etk N-terminal domain-containing protein [Chloroflexota bacterium]|nr:Wzz/FepE/Etk N-terminal domain-containing protein [Chloroflexota bacterium]
MQIDFRQIIRGLQKRWWLALIVTLAAAGAAYLYSKSQPSVYQSQVTLVANSFPTDNGTIEAIKKTMPTYAQQLGSKELWKAVVDDPDNGIADVDVDALGGLIKVQARPDQNALVMTVDNKQAETAALLADRISNAYVEQQMSQNQDVGSGNERVVWSIAQAAEVPLQPYQPRPLLNAAAAGLFGLILGLLLVIGIELTDTTLKNSADVQQYIGLNTLGVIPRAQA